MKQVGRLTCVLLAGLWLVVAPPRTQADGVEAPWAALPGDAKLVTDPAALRALVADHTVHAIYLPDGPRWREYSAADGRTIWEFDGCLHPGTWRVSGSVLCYTYPTWDDGRPQCFLVYQSAKLTHFVWLNPTTGTQVLVSNALDLTKGNSDHLPLEGAPTCADPAV
jgi:hypothetical protein